MCWVFSWILWSVLASPKIKTSGLGSHGHVRKSRNHEHDGFSVFPVMNLKSYQSEMKQNNYTELSGYSLNHIRNQNCPKNATHAKDAFLLPEFAGFAIGNRPLFGHVLMVSHHKACLYTFKTWLLSSAQVILNCAKACQ